MNYHEDLLPFAVGLELPHPEIAFDQHTDSKLLDWIETVTSAGRKRRAIFPTR
jgi:hypothetical protein